MPGQPAIRVRDTLGFAVNVRFQTDVLGTQLATRDTTFVHVALQQQRRQRAYPNRSGRRHVHQSEQRLDVLHRNSAWRPQGTVQRSSSRMELWLSTDEGEVFGPAPAFSVKTKAAPRTEVPGKTASGSTAMLSASREQGSGDGRTRVDRRRLKLLFQLACDAESKGRFAEAASLARQCLELDEYDARSWLLLARLEASLVHADDRSCTVSVVNGTEGIHVCTSHQRARNTYRQGVLMCPDSVHLLHAWAMFEYRLGEIETARELFRRGLALDPANAYIYHSWGLMECRRGGFEKAQQLYVEASACCLNDAICSAWAELEARGGRMRLARCIFELGLVMLLRDFADTLHLTGSDTEEHNPNREAVRDMPYGSLRSLVRVLVAEHLREKERPPVSGLCRKERDMACLSPNADARPTPGERSERALRALLLDWLSWYRDGRNPNLIHIRLTVRTRSRRGDRYQLAADHCVQYADSELTHGSITRTREILQWALDLDPTNVKVLLACARLDAQRGAHERARSLFRAAESALRKRGTAVERIDDAQSASHRVGVSLYTSWATMEMNLSRPVEANAVLERGNERFPRNHALYQTWALVQEKRGQPDAARQLLEQSVRLRPNAPAYVAWALLEEREGHLDTARELFEAALQVDPSHSATYNAYGRLEARAGDLEKARRVFLRGLHVQQAPCIYHGFALVELRYGNGIRRAEEILLEGIAQKSDRSMFLWHTLGALAFQQKKYEKAREIFAQALQIYPSNSRLLLGAALSYAAEATALDAERPRQLFRRALQEDSFHGHAWQCWGVFESRLGNVDAARLLFERGVERCPFHVPLWQAYALLESTAGNIRKARILFERGMQLESDHVHLLNAYACMEARVGNYQKAQCLLERALRIDPGHGATWNARALLELRRGNQHGAREVLEEGLGKDANHAPLYRTYARLELALGNVERARLLIEQGLVRDASDSGLIQLRTDLQKPSAVFTAGAFERWADLSPRESAGSMSVLARLQAELSEASISTTDFDLFAIQSVDDALQEGHSSIDAR